MHQAKDNFVLHGLRTIRTEVRRGREGKGQGRGINIGGQNGLGRTVDEHPVAVHPYALFLEVDG